MARAATTSDVFNAVAEPRRRAILSLLAGGERTVGDVARELRLSQPSTSKHLAVLREVRLVTRRREGREMLYRTDASSIRPIHDWASSFELFWNDQLDEIKRIAEERASRRGESAPSDAAQTPGDKP